MLQHAQRQGTAAVSWGPDRIDLFTVDEHARLVHRVFVSGAWGEAESLGGTLASLPTATAWGVDKLRVFAIFPDGALWNRYWDGTSWHAWETLGGKIGAARKHLVFEGPSKAEAQRAQRAYQASFAVAHGGDPAEYAKPVSTESLALTMRLLPRDRRLPPYGTARGQAAVTVGQEE